MRAVFRRNSVFPANEAGNLTVIPPILSDKSIECGILEQSVDLFLSNDFTTCLTICSMKETSSIYHAFAKAVLCFMNAATVQHGPEVDNAVGAIRSCLKLCHSSRRRSSLLAKASHIMNHGSGHSDIYTDYECHAELISGEARLLLVLLDMMKTDQSPAQFLKSATSNIDYSVSSSKLCLEVLEKRCKWESAASQANFKSGLYLSIGVLNIMLAMMPRKMEEELRKDACYGDRDLGITYLTEAMEFSGVQRKLSCLASLVAGCIISPDPGTPDHLHRKFHLQHPQSAFLSFLSGKLAISKQKHVEGRQDLRQSLILQSEWRELRAACVKELMWSHVCLLEWDEAKECAESLLQGTAWCPQLYHFLIAGFLQAKEGLERVQTKKEPYFQQSAETQGIIRECMKKVKELSEGAEDRTNLESMMMDQATAYVEEGKDLLVPVIEVMYESNRLRHMPMDQMAKITVLLEKRVFKLIRDEDLMADLEAEFGDPLDGYAKLYLLISVCHKYARPKPGMDRDSHVEYAIYKLKNTLEKKRKIKDTRVIARTTMHLGMMLCDARKAMEGRFWLETVEQDHADVLTLSECIMIDQYLRQSVPETDDDFQQPRKLSLRRSSAVDVQAKMLKQLARRRSGSIGYEHSGEFAAQPPSLLAGHIPGILTE